MAKVLKFPQQDELTPEAPFQKAMAAIESRFGVSIQYIGVNGKRSAETQAKMKKALQKETFRIKDHYFTW